MIIKDMVRFPNAMKSSVVTRSSDGDREVVLP